MTLIEEKIRESMQIWFGNVFRLLVRKGQDSCKPKKSWKEVAKNDLISLQFIYDV